jgi:hypothetical protein
MKEEGRRKKEEGGGLQDLDLDRNSKLATCVIVGVLNRIRKQIDKVNTSITVKIVASIHPSSALPQLWFG